MTPSGLMERSIAIALKVELKARTRAKSLLTPFVLLTPCTLRSLRGYPYLGTIFSSSPPSPPPANTSFNLFSSFFFQGLLCPLVLRGLVLHDIDVKEYPHGEQVYDEGSAPVAYEGQRQSLGRKKPHDHGHVYSRLESYHE